MLIKGQRNYVHITNPAAGLRSNSCCLNADSRRLPRIQKWDTEAEEPKNRRIAGDSIRAGARKKNRFEKKNTKLERRKKTHCQRLYFVRSTVYFRETGLVFFGEVATPIRILLVRHDFSKSCRQRVPTPPALSPKIPPPPASHPGSTTPRPCRSLSPLRGKTTQLPWRTQGTYAVSS